jgi:hypothetical protein
MIVSYRDKRTRDFAAGKRIKAFSGIERPVSRGETNSFRSASSRADGTNSFKKRVFPRGRSVAVAI